MSEVAVLEQRGSSLGLDIADDLPFDEWVEMGRRLRQAVDRAGWWVGDWVNYGEVTYGGKYELALEVTGMKYPALRDCAMVARGFELSRRRDNVTFLLHREILPLDRDAQERWLDRIEQEGLTHQQVRDGLALERSGRSSTIQLQRVTIGSLDPERAQRWRDAAERSGKEFVEWAAEVLDQAAA